jgi:alkylated DNA nucleotide flippase Atl1
VEPIRASASAASVSDARIARIIARIRAIPEGAVETYGDIDRAAPRLVGHVLATTHHDVPWHRVVRADGSVAMGARQLERLRSEGVRIRGDRVDLRRARREVREPAHSRTS